MTKTLDLVAELNGLLADYDADLKATIAAGAPLRIGG